MPLSRQQRQIIHRCQQSVTWFLRNFGKLKHPSAGVLPFHPFSYQRNAIKAFRKNRLNIFRKCRQSGASKISGAFATWFAMFHSHKTILIVSRRNDDAMSFLHDHVTFLYEHLPGWMKDLWKPAKQNEHEIIFPNGSKIQSLTSHPDVLRSHASSLNIIDEAAFIQGMDVMWAGGWPCRVGNTLIQTEEGLQKIGSFDISGLEWQKLEINVATDDGYKFADKLHIPNHGNIVSTVRVKTKFGYEEEGTPHHRLRSIDENGEYVWKQLDQFKYGDIICSLPGQFQGKRQYLSDGNISLELSPQLAEIIGLYVADGTIYSSRPKRFKIHFDPQDWHTRDYAIKSLNNILTFIDNPTLAYSEDGNCTINLRLNSAPFVDFLCSVGLKSKTNAQDAEIPAAILKSDRAVVCAFLRGLFDANGWCYQSSTSLKLGFSTQSKELAHQVQILLHSLGILSKIVRPANTENRFGTEPAYRVRLLNAQSKQLFKEIGFLTPRKQKCLDLLDSSFNHLTITHSGLLDGFFDELDQKLKGFKSESARLTKQNLYHWKRKQRVTYSAVEEVTELFGLNNNLSQLVMRGFVFDTVIDCEESSAEVFDISVPDNNTYLANGIVNHNTLQHGGNVIVISTTNGKGNWYWSTCTDAEAGLNQFNPIIINWWDMDWAIEYKDPLSLRWKRIAPRDDIRECTTPQEIEKYGPYWSPWLEEQYQALQEQGEAWKFKQEILASFIGSGNTVLSESAISFISSTVRDPARIIRGYQAYVQPVTGEVEDLTFDFAEPDEGLWIWKDPVTATADKMRGSDVISRGQATHSYVMGVDIATGKGRDYSAIEVFDIDEMEQVAEFMARCLPRELVKYIDRIGRWYNCALAVVERNNGGDIIIDNLRYDVMYPRLWRKKDINDRPSGPRQVNRQRAMNVQPYGFSTSTASKPTLNKFLIDCLRDTEGEGYTIFSRRLLKQISTYVRKRDRMGRDTGKTEAEEGAANFDDLVIACGLALIGTRDTSIVDAGNLMPYGATTDFTKIGGNTVSSDKQTVESQKEYMEKGGPALLMPMALAPDLPPEIAAQQELANYAASLGGIPISHGQPSVVPPKQFYSRRRSD